MMVLPVDGSQFERVDARGDEVGPDRRDDNLIGQEQGGEIGKVLRSGEVQPPLQDDDQPPGNRYGRRKEGVAHPSVQPGVRPPSGGMQLEGNDPAPNSGGKHVCVMHDRMIPVLGNNVRWNETPIPVEEYQAGNVIVPWEPSLKEGSRDDQHPNQHEQAHSRGGQVQQLQDRHRH
jgi:hypothetical protein